MEATTCAQLTSVQTCIRTLAVLKVISLRFTFSVPVPGARLVKVVLPVDDVTEIVLVEVEIEVRVVVRVVDVRVVVAVETLLLKVVETVVVNTVVVLDARVRVV